MYKAAVRWMIRRNIGLLNEGNYKPALGMFATEGELAFPGRNSFASEFREPVLGREAFVTHRGHAEIEGFLKRYVATGMYMQVDDILVNGPPWNTRAAVRVHHWSRSDDDERDIYCNRAILMVRAAWGKIKDQEDYEDTERLAAFDRLLQSSGRGA